MSDEHLQASSQDVERIRDIIFGTQMRDYQQLFEALVFLYENTFLPFDLLGIGALVKQLEEFFHFLTRCPQKVLG